MTHRDNITAILECHFAGFKEEIIESACNRILEQEERDIKTGHWIKTPHGFKCSKCLIVHSHTSIFCPSCGAKMVEWQ